MLHCNYIVSEQLFLIHDCVHASTAHVCYYATIILVTSA